MSLDACLVLTVSKYFARVTGSCGRNRVGDAKSRILEKKRIDIPLVVLVVAKG